MRWTHIHVVTNDIDRLEVERARAEDGTRRAKTWLRLGRATDRREDHTVLCRTGIVL